MIYCNYPGAVSAGMVELADTMDLGAVTSVKNYCSISGARDLKN